MPFEAAARRARGGAGLANDHRYFEPRPPANRGCWGVPSVCALDETTFLAGLSKARMPEE